MGTPEPCLPYKVANSIITQAGKKSTANLSCFFRNDLFLPFFHLIFIWKFIFPLIYPYTLMIILKQEESMESIKRSILLLRPGDGPYAYPQSRAMLKMQASAVGLSFSFTSAGLPAGGYMLYLFLQDGATIYAGDIIGGSLRQTLPGIRLNSVWGAAVIHSASLTFCLKSTDADWKDAMLRFKLLHTPSPAKSVPPPEPAATIEETQEEDSETFLDETDYSTASAYEPDAAAKDEHSSQSPYMMTPSEPLMPSPKNDDDNDEEDICRSCPHATRQERINPFPLVFPQSEWVKMSYPGPTGWWHYITGHIYSGTQIVAKAVGVPGEYGMMPPVWLEGFGTYLRCVTPDAHGYWLMFQDAETGEVLDMGLSPRDA
jgi:hypothetical protein